MRWNSTNAYLNKNGGTENPFWLLVWILWLSIYWEFHHPNWRSHIFQRGRYTTNQLYLLLMSSFIRNSHVWCFRIANFHTEVGGQHGGLDSSTLLQADEAINDEARGWWAGDSDLVMTDGERRSIAKLVKTTRFNFGLWWIYHDISIASRSINQLLTGGASPGVHAKVGSLGVPHLQTIPQLLISNYNICICAYTYTNIFIHIHIYICVYVHALLKTYEAIEFN